MRFPDQHLSVVTLCNVASAPSTLAAQVASVYLGGDMKAQDVAALDPTTFSPGAAPFRSGAETNVEARRRADELSRAAGTFYNVDLDMTVTLAPRDGALLLQRPGAEPMRFSVVSGDLFSTRDQVLMLLLRDQDGAVRGFTLSLGRVRDLPFARK